MFSKNKEVALDSIVKEAFAVVEKIDYRSRLEEKLREHLTWMRNSCTAFDQGEESEAIRLAGTLRTLFHDSTGKTRNPSISLMTHLGLKSGKILSSGRGHQNTLDYLRYSFNLASSNPAKMMPILGENFREVPIDYWWNKETIHTHNGNSIPRRTLILDAANKDGHAHVDTDLPKYYETLMSVGDPNIAISISGLSDRVDWVTFEENKSHFARNSHLALIRQFAHEFLASVDKFKWLND